MSRKKEDVKIPSDFLLPSPAPGAGEWGWAFEDRPAAGGAGLNLFPKHSADHRAASGRAARSRASAASPAHRLETFRPGLNRLDDDPFADFIAQAYRPEGVDNRLFSGFPNFV